MFSQSEYNVSKGDAVTITIGIYAQPKVSNHDVIVTHSNANISIEGATVRTSPQSVSVSFHTVTAIVTGINIKIRMATVKEEYFGELKIQVQNGEGNIITDVILTPQGKFIYGPLEAKNLSKMRKKCGFTSNYTCAVESVHLPSIRTHSIVSSDSVCGQ